MGKKRDLHVFVRRAGGLIFLSHGGQMKIHKKVSGFRVQVVPRATNPEPRFCIFMFSSAHEAQTSQNGANLAVFASYNADISWSDAYF